ncbi:MAG: hypothetical protein MK102_09160 [Fuerstiella sp.]|nr:hypothetical protein [Fuerstiella sp.]
MACRTRLDLLSEVVLARNILTIGSITKLSSLLQAATHELYDTTRACRS